MLIRQDWNIYNSFAAVIGYTNMQLCTLLSFNACTYTQQCWHRIEAFWPVWVCYAQHWAHSSATAETQMGRLAAKRCIGSTGALILNVCVCVCVWVGVCSDVCILTTCEFLSGEVSYWERYVSRPIEHPLSVQHPHPLLLHLSSFVSAPSFLSNLFPCSPCPSFSIFVPS